MKKYNNEKSESKKLFYAHCDTNGVLEVEDGIKNIEPLNRLKQLYDNAELDKFVRTDNFHLENSLKILRLPKSVKNIADGVFKDFFNLKEIQAPKNSNFKIGDETFKNCVNLVSLPKDVTISKIGIGAFEGCSKLEKIDFEKDINFDYDTIKRYSFRDCYSLSSAVLSEPIKRIEDAAFMNCVSLKDIKLPRTLERIEDNAFAGCKNLSFVILPETIRSIGKNVFQGCNSNISLVLSNGLSNTFRNNQQSVKIDESTLNKFKHFIDYNGDIIMLSNISKKINKMIKDKGFNLISIKDIECNDRITVVNKNEIAKTKDLFNDESEMNQ